MDSSIPANGDEIWVKQGIYTLANQINATATVQIYGGFAGWEVQRKQRNWWANETIIDGNDSVRCFYFEHSGASSLLDGLIIRNGNASSEGGGAIFNSKASPRITNCIFWGGSTAGAPSEIENGSGAAPAVTYCNVQGGYPGAGNINANPLFQNASAGNFRLQPGSPCIDHGTNDALLLEYDLEGNPRVFDKNNDGNAIVDMGAYEYRPAGFGAGDVNDDGAVTLADAILTLKILSGIQPLSPPPRTSEVNYDGKIGLEEALFILQTISGLRP